MGDIYVYPVETSLYFDSALARASRWISWQLHPLVLLLGATGIALAAFSLRRRPDVDLLVPALLAGLAVYYTALFTVFTPWPRYGIPLRPELYVLATWSGVRLWQRFAERLRTVESS